MMIRKRSLAIALVMIGQVHAADLTLFDNFTPLTGNPAACRKARRSSCRRQTSARSSWPTVPTRTGWCRVRTPATGT